MATLALGEHVEGTFLNGKAYGQCTVRTEDGSVKWRGNIPVPPSKTWQQIPVEPLMPRVAVATGRLKKAESEAAKALEREPENPQLIVRLADILHRLERWSEARELRERLQKCNIPPIERFALTMVSPTSEKDVWTKEKYIGYAAMTYRGGLLGKVPHGNGKLTCDRDGLCFYEGPWKNGVMHGECTIHFPDGGVYQGRVDNNRIHGPGRLTRGDGSIHEGFFVNDVPHGPGVAYAPPSQRQIGLEQAKHAANPFEPVGFKTRDEQCHELNAARAAAAAEEDRIYGQRPLPYTSRELPYGALSVMSHNYANMANVAATIHAHRENTVSWLHNQTIFKAGTSRVFVSYDIRNELPTEAAAVAKHLYEAGLDPADYTYHTQRFEELRTRVKSKYNSEHIKDNLGYAALGVGLPIAAINAATGQLKNRTVDAVPTIQAYMNSLNAGMHNLGIPLSWKIDVIYMKDIRYEVTLERTPIATSGLSMDGLSLEARS